MSHAPHQKERKKKVRYYFQVFNKQKRKNKTVHTCHEELVVDKLVQELLKPKKKTKKNVRVPSHVPKNKNGGTKPSQ